MTARWVLGSTVAVGLAAAAFLFLDPIVAAFIAIMLVTVAIIGVLSSDWDRHSTFEERELERARRRKEKWERGAAARERDRAKWEAHRARRAKKAGQGR